MSDAIIVLMLEYVVRDWWRYSAALGLGVFLFLVLQPAARKAGLVDQPSQRKLHLSPIPLVGGIGIFLTFALSLTLFEISLTSYRMLLFCAGSLVIIGVLDDYIDVPARLKFFAQSFIALLLVLGGGVVVTELGLLVSDKVIGLGPVWATVFTVIAVIGVINAFNMLDGLDGLCGVMALICFSALLILYFLSGNNRIAEDVVFLLLFIVVLSTFLLFNFDWIVRDKQVFLGDAGSMLIGVVVAFFLVTWAARYPASDNPLLKVTSAPWLIALPIMDMVRVMLVRLIRGKSPFRASRDHIHHLLQELGFSQFLTLVVLSIVQLMFAFIGVLATVKQWPDAILFWSMFPIFVIFSVLGWVIETWTAGRKTVKELHSTSKAKVVGIDDDRLRKRE
ncbi:MAG: hypothetical protein CL398_01820 [Acidiferrobacteraceae bacterium]|nr:hypothetical protein [Acidiferrobacteraceae bacterium]|tara:strand:- start:4035 stop:5210 length:1176 start_codon:yes stop_codon:yes gene_type:complete